VRKARTKAKADATARSVIRVEGLNKLYRRNAPGFQLRTLKSALLDRSLTEGLRPEDTIPALEDISFDVRAGEAFGVIGSNGSGKSTLLKIVAGILKPSSGSVVVDGRVAALIELGAGFHPEISGRENIYINGVVLGLTKKEIDSRYDSIVEFSGLGDFIDEPVKNYSSGMYVRLGFAVAIHTDPDVLLVDEVLAVGDEAFAHRCLRRIEEFLASGRSLLLVSHSLDLVEAYSDRVLWIDGGKQRLLGSPRRVADAYRQAVAEDEGRAHRAAKEARERELAAAAGEPAETGETEDTEGAPGSAAEDGSSDVSSGDEQELQRWGSREAEITSVRMLDDKGEERYHFGIGESVRFELSVRANEKLDDFVFGIAVSTPRGVECWGTNTGIEGLKSESFEGEGKVTIHCPDLRLGAGEYLIDVAVHEKEGYPYDYHREILSFSITSALGRVGVYSPEHEWSFDGAIRWKPEERE